MHGHTNIKLTKMAYNGRKILYPSKHPYINQLVVGEEERW
jgi:hypothetical protein